MVSNTEDLVRRVVEELAKYARCSGMEWTYERIPSNTDARRYAYNQGKAFGRLKRR